MATDQDNSYWKSLDEGAAASGEMQDEFPEPTERIQLGFNRRDFLLAAGFAFTGAVAGCGRAPVQQALPYIEQPEGITPGRTCLYASTCGECPAGCGLLARVRDGRPIKLEGNPEHPLSWGGLCAVGQASILGLYDQQRLQHPLEGGEKSTWEEVDRRILARLEQVRKQGGAVRFLSGTLAGPTLRSAVGRFVSRFPDGRHVVHDVISASAILDAHEKTHGVRVLPRYRLDRAEVIVGLDADFLGAWVAPVEMTRAYSTGRTVEDARPRMSYHVQFESRMSLTGSKADQRLVVAPGAFGLLLTHLAVRVAARAGVNFSASGLAGPPVEARFLDHLAGLLWASRRRSLLVCGVQDVATQVLVNFVNHLLDGYGTTLDIHQPYQCQGNDRDVKALLDEIQAGQVAALFVYRSNPIHDLPGGEKLADAIRRVPLVVSLAERLDETASLAHFVCPDHHYLESWGDVEGVGGVVGIIQPTVRPLGNTRPALESLAAWSGKPRSAQDQVREYWERSLYPRRTKGSFQAFWDTALQDGHVVLKPEPLAVKPFAPEVVQPIVTGSAPDAGKHSVVLYAKVAMRESRLAFNPWLHELPDPITKVCWDNYACLSPATATALGVSEGDVVRLDCGDESLDLPAFVQPGQHDGIVAVALGYGSKLSERFASIGPRWLEGRPGVGPNGKVGHNAAPLLRWEGGSLRYVRDGVRLVKTGRKQPLASTQGHHSVSVPPRLALPGIERRPIVRETTLQALLAPSPEKEHGHHADLWPPDHETSGPRWGMAIDLTACTGCSACVVACQVENNIPVVGKDEVRRRRDMHWLRIDRYYSDDGASVIHQPMLCQHCGNAPCEVVCPVLATVHSSDGLNQQVYNRCVGTRYCANNCPYKVRRFNWFDYPHDDVMHNLVLNPDVTVRSRGVMEKCTFCIQRIQEARIEGGRLGKPLADGDIRTACQESCPAGAIVFGDLNDPKSRAAKLAASQRGYQVLAELNVKPAITYLQRVRNLPIEKEGGSRG